MTRRVAETGQVRAALIAGPGYLGGLGSISDPDAEAFYEVVALSNGTWTTWDPRFVREVALQDAGLAVSLLDRLADHTVVLNMRLDERSFENARQRLATILTRYGKVIFDTPHPVAQRADLAAMIGTSREMMYRALRELEANGLVERQRSGGINVLDEERLARLVRWPPRTALRRSDHWRSRCRAGTAWLGGAERRVQGPDDEGDSHALRGPWKERRDPGGASCPAATPRRVWDLSAGIKIPRDDTCRTGPTC